MGKFSAQAAKFEVDLSDLLSRTIRAALLAGLIAAVRTTKQDSSNAAAHWTIKAKGSQRSAGRAWQKVRDLRHTKDRKRTPPIGKRRDGGVNAAEVLVFVRNREMKDVVDKFVSGRSPSTVFSFYNPVDEDAGYKASMEGSLTEAGNAAVDEVALTFLKRWRSGTRKRR